MAVGPPIEFLPWYEPGAKMVRCEGTAGCGALVMSEDAERHKNWHHVLIDALINGQGYTQDMLRYSLERMEREA